MRSRTLESVGNPPNHRLVLWGNRNFAGCYSLVEVYAGARVCQESCAWRCEKCYQKILDTYFKTEWGGEIGGGGGDGGYDPGDAPAG